MSTEGKPEDATAAAAAAPEASDETAQVAAVKERLGFFFSNANVRQDNFLRKYLLQEDGSAGAVPIESLLKFNTIRKITTDANVVAKAAAELPDLLVVDDAKVHISRKDPFTRDMMQGHIPLTLYVRNVPVTQPPKPDGEDKKDDAGGGGDGKFKRERPRYAVTVEDVRKLFDSYGKVAMIKLRHSTGFYDKGDFDIGLGDSSRKPKRKRNYPIGHAMVEFEKLEDAEKAAAATLTWKDGKEQEPSTPLELGEGDTKSKLAVMMFAEYVELRKVEKVKEDAEREEKYGKKRKEAGDAEEAEPPTYKYDWKPGCVIQIKGLPDSCDRETLLEAVSKSMEISVDAVKDKKIYVDYSRGQTEGAIRFREPTEDVAKLADKLKSGDQTIKDSKVADAFILKDAEEKEYWDKFIEFKTKQMRHKFEEKNAKRRKRGRRN